MSVRVDETAPDVVKMALDEAIRLVLQRPIVGILGTQSPSGAPHLTAVWYMMHEDRLLVATAESSKKVAHVRANPVVELCVNAGPVGPCVTVHGTATIGETLSSELLMELAVRYLGPKGGERYVAARDLDSKSLVIVVAPERWRVFGMENPADGGIRK
jgi:PPOX class probable F420-dependent enzyme